MADHYPLADDNGDPICPGCVCDCQRDGCPKRDDCDNECWCENTRPEPTDDKFGRALAETLAPAMAQVGEQFLPTPTTDPIGAVRVHPDDDPEDPNARRIWKVRANRAPVEIGPEWVNHRVPTIFSGKVTDWPRQSLTDVARVLEHDAP